MNNIYQAILKQFGTKNYTQRYVTTPKDFELLQVFMYNFLIPKWVNLLKPKNTPWKQNLSIPQKYILLKECRSYFKTFEFIIAMLRTAVMKG